MPRRSAAVVLSIALSLVAAPIVRAQSSFRVDETSIADVHAAMRSGKLTCHALVQAYIARIDAYDKQGPALNAITQVNPDAIATADSLDRRYAATKQFVGPLHCIPMLVKDNFQTIGLQTAVGNLAMKGYTPTKDAFEVKRVKAAGAIVLAKTNMAEFAFSPEETVNSLMGTTHNPFAPDHVTAGSSGGTGAGVSANFGEVGLGTDTGNSIRGPSSHNALVGIRSTMGLTSRAGIAPLSLFADIAGPMARTVTDAATVLQVVAGYDPDDPATAVMQGRTIPNYAAALDRNGLKGARVGILRQAYERASMDTEVVRVFAKAVADLRAAGATVIDTVVVPGLDSIRRSNRGNCNPFQPEFNQWLADQGGRAPVKDLAEIVASGKYDPSIASRLKSALQFTDSPATAPACVGRERVREGLRAATTKVMDDLKLDALIYPTWSNPPRLIGDETSPSGDNSQVFSPTTGMPALTVPMGYTRGNTLPAGLQMLGRAFDESRIIKLAYAYEQATKWRREPPTVPPIK